MASSSYAQQCGVCHEIADSVHFGGVSCRACAAFFRRKVASNQVPMRRCAGQCSTTNPILRRLCQSCRFDKCLMIGMQPSSVISRIPVRNSDIPTTSGPKSLLEQLGTAYGNFLEARRKAFRLDENRAPQFCNYKTLNEVHLIEIDLIVQHILSFFRDQMGEDNDYNKVLLPNFKIPFMLFEGSFRSCHTDYWILGNGDFVDVEQLDRLYQIPDNVDDKIGKYATSLFEPYWKQNQKTLGQDMRELQLELPEFLLLSALIYWDFGFRDQTDECIEICKRKRSEVLEELTNYEKTVRRDEDHCMRIANIMIILHTVQKAFNVLRETKEVSMAYDLYETHPHFFELMKI